MSIEEMELFEAECKLLCYKGNMSRSNLGSFYNNEQTNWMYQMWLSGKNREGYKLVPLEATQEMVDAVYNSTLASDDLENIYTAMINSHDNN